MYSPYNESETKEDRGFVDMEESFVDDLKKVLDDTKDKVSATKVLDSSVATGGKAVNIFWDGGWTGNVADTFGLLAFMDIQAAIFSIILVAAIIVLNTGSLLLCFAGDWPPFELSTLHRSARSTDPVFAPRSVRSLSDHHVDLPRHVLLDVHWPGPSDTAGALGHLPYPLCR